MSAEAISSEADPAAFLAAYEGRARRVETPCGEGTMVWRIWGDGPPLVLGHGGQGAWSHWIRTIDTLADRFKLIVPDLPGHGDSAMPAQIDHASISAAIAGGLRELLPAGQKADFAGFSFGGAALAYCAAQHPGVVRRVIIVGTGGLGTPHGQINIGRVGGLAGEERRAAIKSNLLGLMLHHAESVDELARHLLVANGRKARLPVMELVVPDKLLQILPNIGMPIDAIWGEFDRPHPNPPLQEKVLRRFQPDMEFRVIDDAGHWAMYERPEAFNATLLDMLRKPLRPKSSGAK